LPIDSGDLARGGDGPVVLLMHGFGAPGTYLWCYPEGQEPDSTAGDFEAVGLAGEGGSFRIGERLFAQFGCTRPRRDRAGGLGQHRDQHAQPLDITKDEIELAIALIDQCLTKAKRDLGASAS